MPDPNTQYGLTGGPELHVCNPSGSQDKILTLDDAGDLLIAAVKAMVSLGGAKQIRAYKDADQIKTTDITLADDSKLFLPLLANKKYPIHGVIFIDHQPSPDFKWTYTVPAGATLKIADFITIQNNSGIVIPRIITSSGAAQVHLSSVAALNALHMFGTVNMGSTAGNLAYGWAQNTSSATAATVKEGSELVAVEV